MPKSWFFLLPFLVPNSKACDIFFPYQYTYINYIIFYGLIFNFIQLKDTSNSEYSQVATPPHFVLC